MCGRFTLSTPAPQVATLFGAKPPPDVVPRYNIAPTQQVLAVRALPDGSRDCSWLRWGLIPSWTKLQDKAPPVLIGARADTVATKPAFRSAFKTRRCLIPADGFFEWKQIPGQKVKQPYLIRRPNRELFAFAGLWERWIDAQGKPIDSCTIITTDANQFMQQIHDRMPVILPKESYAQWLDPKPAKPEELQALLSPPEQTLTMLPVSTLVNNSRVDQPGCIEPAETAADR
jgi:putative SOS response-associated peptidase YedK